MVMSKRGYNTFTENNAYTNNRKKSKRIRKVLRKESSWIIKIKSRDKKQVRF